MLRPLTAGLLLLTHAAAVSGQVDSLPEALTPGTPAFRELQVRINEQERVRATTTWGVAELYAPQLTDAGLDFGRARFKKRPRRRVAGFERPLPFTDISQIDVRVGNPTAGALLGAAAGLLLSAGLFGLCDDCGTGSSEKAVITVTLTAAITVIGAMIGRDGWGWRAVYRAPPGR